MRTSTVNAEKDVENRCQGKSFQHHQRRWTDVFWICFCSCKAVTGMAALHHHSLQLNIWNSHHKKRKCRLEMKSFAWNVNAIRSSWHVQIVKQFAETLTAKIICWRLAWNLSQRIRTEFVQPHDFTQRPVCRRHLITISVQPTNVQPHWGSSGKNLWKKGAYLLNIHKHSLQYMKSQGIMRI